jgi:lysylphosphatidylglycerol synthetase-like protein (DUF2156 family)
MLPRMHRFEGHAVPHSEPDAAWVGDLVDRFGANANSLFVRYAAPWRFHVGARTGGAVPYLVVGRTAIGWSDPLCESDRRAELLAEYLREMRASRLRVVLVAVDQAMARAALDLGCSVINVGAEPAFDLSTWRIPRGDPGKHLRWCLNHARRARIEVEEYEPGAQRRRDIQAEMAALQHAWEDRLAGKVVRSFLRTDPMSHEGSRIFVARSHGRLEAFLACSSVPARDGWYLEDLVRQPTATNGATELLVVETLQRLQAEGSSFATLGIAPFRGAKDQLDRRARILMPAVRWGLTHFDRRYRFASMSQYKAKFGPSHWETRYVAFSPSVPSVGTIRATIAALDPPESAREPVPIRSRGERAVLGQAMVLVVASLLVLARSLVGQGLGGTAGLLAPVGMAGLLTAVLLFAVAFRVGRVAGRIDLLAAVGVEVVLLFGAFVRIHDGRFVPFEILAAAFAGVSIVLLVRPEPEAARRASED